MFRRFLNLFRPNQLEEEIREELESHRSRSSGSFGNFTSIQDQTREASTIVWLETLVQDVRYGIRQLVRTPLISMVAVLSLTLGIGANTAVFTLVNAVTLRTLPVRDPGRLVLFYDGISTGVYRGDKGYPTEIFSYRAWEYFRDHNEAFEGLCAFRQSSDGLVMQVAASADSGRKEQATGYLVSGNYFSVLGVRPAAGRVLTPADDTLAATPTAVISYRFWRSRFNLDTAVVGTAVELNGTVFTIVGVAAPEFFGERVESPPDFWVPLTHQAEIMQRESWQDRQDVYWLNLMGRLKQGLTRQGAEASVNTQLHQFYTVQVGGRPSAEQLRQISQAHVVLRPGARGISWLRFRYSEPLHVLMGIVALVLLIACVNIATLLLARASARRRELFVRLALGSSRRRLIRQLLTESLLLACLGGATGVVFAWWGARVLVVVFGAPSVVDIRPDLLVLCFTLGTCILTGFGFGLGPALRATAIELRSSPEARTLALSRLKSARALVVLQVALSVLLLVGAGLLTHSLLALVGQDLGFRPENVLLVRTDARLAGYQPAELYPFYVQLQERLNALPGVVSASIARYTPLSGSSSSSNFSLQGYTPPAGKEMKVYGVEVGPGFFETLGIPLIQGRSIGPRDTPTSPAVAVVNQSFINQYLPNQNPIGRRFRLGSPFREPAVEIVGVVPDSKYYDIRENAKPMAYFSAWQTSGREAYVGEILIRTSRNPADVAGEVRRALNDFDARLPVLRVTSLGEQVYKSVQKERMLAQFCSFFGLLALLLASIGLYGTLAYSVARRTGEIGLRMALGARRPQVLWMVLRESLLLVLVGLACGLPLAIGATRWLRSFLFGIPTLDPVGIGAAIILLTTASTLAGYLPARRATKIDPLVALRCE